MLNRPREKNTRPIPAARRALHTAAAISATLTRLTLLVLAALLVTGCQAPLPPAAPTALIVRIPDYDAFLDDSLSLLRRYDFTPDYVDRDRGRIISQPSTSGQWFEFWRVDSQGTYQLVESSLHTLRRVVTVDVKPLDTPPADTAAAPEAASADATPNDVPTAQPPASTADADPRYRLAVRVDKYRYSAPERQVTTASGALAIYSERLPTTEGLRGAASRGAAWVPLGRDALLEGFLIEKLADVHPAVQVVDEPPPDADTDSDSATE